VVLPLGVKREQHPALLPCVTSAYKSPESGKRLQCLNKLDVLAVFAQASCPGSL